MLLQKYHGLFGLRLILMEFWTGTVEGPRVGVFWGAGMGSLEACNNYYMVLETEEKSIVVTERLANGTLLFGFTHSALAIS